MTRPTSINSAQPQLPHGARLGTRRWFWWLTALLCLNAALAFGYHFLGWNPATDAKADAPALVIAPQSIAVVPANAVPPATALGAEPASASAATLALANPAISAQCWVWGPFSDVQAQTLAAKAQSAGLPAAQAQATPVTASHIILMGPYANRAALDKKLGELKRMKVADMAVTDTLSISLGVFSSETAAQNQFKALGKLGVRSAKVVKKPAQLSKTSLRFDAVPDAQTPLLQALATDLGTLALCP